MRGRFSRVVLIVEDDADTRIAYQEFLELLGFRVMSVATGEGALEAVRGGHIDAVLLDLSLPDADGRVLNPQLRSIAAPRELPVMALTGHTLSADDRTKFTTVMRKPVDLDAVAAWLREVAPTCHTPGQAR